MIILDSELKVLIVETASPVTTSELPFTVSFVDLMAQAGFAVSAVSGNSGETGGDGVLLNAPPEGVSRQLKYASVYNADTEDALVIVRLDHDSVAIRTIVVASLEPGATLEYVDTAGWRVFPAKDALAFGTMAVQNADDVDITGGLVDATLGSRTPAPATVTEMEATGLGFFRNNTYFGAAQSLLSGNSWEYVFHHPVSDPIRINLTLFNTSDDAAPARHRFVKNRGGPDTWTILQDEDVLSQIQSFGSDGTQAVFAGQLMWRVRGTPGVNSMPTACEIGVHTGSVFTTALSLEPDLTAVFSGLVKNTFTGSITAGTTQTQAGATQMTSTNNIFTVVGTAGDGGRMPAAQAGIWVLLVNEGANSLRVWPISGGTLNGGTVDAADTLDLPAGESRWYLGTSSTNWKRV